MPASDFYPDIGEYLSNDADSFRINVEEMSEIINFICSKTAVTKEVCEIVVKTYFTQLRTDLLNGIHVRLAFGRMKITNRGTPSVGNYTLFRKKYLESQ